MPKRFTDTEIWRKKWYRILPPEQKLLWKYITDNCNSAGVWEIDFDLASIFIGTKIEKPHEEILKRIRLLDDGKWFIPSFIDFQYGELSENCPAHKPVIKLINKYRVLEQYCKGIDTLSNRVSNRVSNTLQDKEKEKEKEKRGIVKGGIPKLEEVLAYCKERKNEVDARKWYDFYSAKGWMIGKNHMKDWRAAVRTWEKTSKERNKSDDEIDDLLKDIPKITKVDK